MVSLVADGEELSVLLNVDLTVATKRSRGVSREKRDLQKVPCLQNATLIDRINVTVFGVGIDYAVYVNCYTVDAPLEAERLVVNTSDCVIRIAFARLCVCILVLPLDSQVRT